MTSWEEKKRRTGEEERVEERSEERKSQGWGRSSRGW